MTRPKTRNVLSAAAAVIVAALPAASETAPKDVAYEEGAVAASLTGGAGDAEAGAKVMTTAALGNCVACHVIEAMPDVQFPGNIAPPLDGVADRYSEAQLRGIVSNAKMTFDGSFMPAFYKTEGFIRPGNAYSGKAPEGDLPPILTGQEIEDVVAYLLTLKE
ncbi:MAG: sulfur oxidation c-type cytochrome SoxX [Rhodobacter sp.]|jgi:sulfur-oxidizing protein SoxX|nr:sulfur oxidation c-type cytochrome SoxX [Rhodobacter sp.]MBK8439074.1 sulfur oxidation c-type cytochrome SoxX [Rhodobacter sp.]